MMATLHRWILLALLCLCTNVQAEVYPAFQNPSATQSLSALFAQNLILKALLHTHGQSDAEKLRILKLTENYLLRFYSGSPLIYSAQTLEELESVRQRYNLDSMGLRDEVETLLRSKVAPRVFVATTSPTVESQLEQYRSLYNERLQLILQQGGGLQISKLQLELAAGGSIADRARLTVIKALESHLESVFSTLDTVGDRIATSPGLKVADPALQIFFSKILSGYFRLLPLETRRDIVAALIDRPDATTDRQRFEIMVLNAGPQIQKLFQVYARMEGFSPELKSVFTQLEQNTKPVPWRHVQAALDAHPMPFTWVNIERRSLGVGTMAQVHAAEIAWPDGRKEKVVVRVIKPGTRQKLAADNEILKRLAPDIDADPRLRSYNFPLLMPFLKELDQMTALEMDVNNTIQRQRQAVDIYEKTLRLQTQDFNGQLELHVPRVLEGSRGEIMIQEFVDGESFEKFAEKRSELARTAVEEVARIWFKETLINSGFYHADLHPGNLRVRLKDNVLRVNLLDFGMTGQIQRSMQDAFITLGIAATVRDADILSRVLWGLSDGPRNEINPSQLKSEIEAQFKRLDAHKITAMPFNEWIAFAVNQGLRFAPEFTSLNRGAVLVLRMLETAQSRVDVSTLLRDLLLKHPGRLTSLVASNPILNKSEMIRLVWDNARNPAPTGRWIPVPFNDPPTDAMARGASCKALFGSAAGF